MLVSLTLQSNLSIPVNTKSVRKFIIATTKMHTHTHTSIDYAWTAEVDFTADLNVAAVSEYLIPLGDQFVPEKRSGVGKGAMAKFILFCVYSIRVSADEQRCLEGV